jgi:hypothetical protein
LRREVRTSHFIERRRIPIVSRVPDVRGVDLAIYEFTGAQPPDPDAELDLAIPLGQRDIRVRMRDLMGGPAR